LEADDPSSLPDKELTEVAEDAISQHLDDVPVKREVELVVTLPAKADGVVSGEGLAEAIRRHFSVRASELTLEVRRRKHRVKLGLMLLALTATISLLVAVGIRDIPQSDKLLTGLVQFFLAGTLTIMNWVVIWDTYEAYILDYQVLLRKLKIYEKVARIGIRVEWV